MYLWSRETKIESLGPGETAHAYARENVKLLDAIVLVYWCFQCGCGASKEGRVAGARQMSLQHSSAQEIEAVSLPQSQYEVEKE